MASVSEPARGAAGPGVPSGLRAWVARNHFWLRRLHSLTGVAPIGGYLIFHFWENATALQSKAQWDEMAVSSRNIQLLIFLELGLILLPILYHAIYGLFIISYTRVNVAAYSYARNRLFMWQRVTGIILLLYIAYHVMALRFGAFLNGHATYTTMHDHLQNPLIFALYTAGILSASFHFGNGLWTFLITWGITIGKRAQRISQWVTTAISVALSVLGLAIIIAIWLQP